jgi:RNA polymerase sigma-70 factor (ECF subfamily)
VELALSLDRRPFVLLPPAAPATPADRVHSRPRPSEGSLVSATPAGELVRRITTGDRAAESELVARYRDGLLFVLRRWSRDPATAEDLCQETLRLALEKIRQGEVREPDQLVGYLRSLAKNLSIQLYRRAGNRTERHEALDAERPLPDPGAGQLDRLLRGEKVRLARRVLGELGSDRDRQVLYRYYIAEDATEAICADLGLTQDHFYRVLHRARGRYRRLFEETAPAV